MRTALEIDQKLLKEAHNPSTIRTEMETVERRLWSL